MNVEVSMKKNIKEWSKFLAKQKVYYGWWEKISTSHAAHNCRKHRTCKICSESHPTGLHKFKLKKKSNDSNKIDSGNDHNKVTTLIKNNCANISIDKCEAAVTGKVFSMCIFLFKISIETSNKGTNTLAMLDTCSLGIFAT